MDQERHAERLGEFQVVLGIYNPATVVLGLLGGFVYTSIVAISLSKYASEGKGIVTMLLFAFLSLLAAFHFWQLGAVDFTRLGAASGLITRGTIFLFIGSVLILGSLFRLVVITAGCSMWNIAWLVLSCLEQAFVGFKLWRILGTCKGVSAS